MPDLKDALERLRQDVSGARLAPAAAVRRDGDRARRRRAGWAAVPVAAALAVAAVVLPSGLFSGPEGGGEPPPASVAPATGPSPDRPWLPRPWRVESVERTSLSAAAGAGDDFCGVAASEGEVPAVRQSLSAGARGVRIYAIATPSFGRASDLFKRVYSECEARGPVSSEEGPAMYWQAAGGVSSAALWDDTTVYLVVSGPPAAGGPQPDLRAVVADVIATVGRACDDSMAGAACPPTRG